MKKNIPISYCRNIGMMFIVICHIIKYYTFIPGSEFLGHFFNVGVEIFLLISGILYGERNEKNVKKFLLQRYQKILFPVQIWTCLMFACSEYKDIRSLFLYFFGLKGLVQRCINN